MKNTLMDPRHTLLHVVAAVALLILTPTDDAEIHSNQLEEADYTSMLEKLRAEIRAHLPKIDEAARKRIEEANDNAERIKLVKAIPAVEALLSSGALDAKLAKLAILCEATPAALAA